MIKLDRRKLIAALELLASDRQGERDAACAAVTRLLRSAGVRWEDLLLSPAPVIDRSHDDQPDELLLRQAMAKLELLDPREQSFVHSLERMNYRGHQFSEKQRLELVAIIRK